MNMGTLQTMDARYSIRKAQLLEECQVAPEVFAQLFRLHTFMEPFVATLPGQAPRAHAQHPGPVRCRAQKR